MIFSGSTGWIRCHARSGTEQNNKVEKKNKAVNEIPPAFKNKASAGQLRYCIFSCIF